MKIPSKDFFFLADLPKSVKNQPTDWVWHVPEVSLMSEDIPEEVWYLSDDTIMPKKQIWHVSDDLALHLRNAVLPEEVWHVSDDSPL